MDLDWDFVSLPELHELLSSIDQVELSYQLCDIYGFDDIWLVVGPVREPLEVEVRSVGVVAGLDSWQGLDLPRP